MPPNHTVFRGRTRVQNLESLAPKSTFFTAPIMKGKKKKSLDSALEKRLFRRPVIEVKVVEDTISIKQRYV